MGDFNLETSQSFDPPTLKDLFKVNYIPLFNKIKNVLHSWSSKWLSRLERVDLIKSVVLPQFLFLFQTLPTEIPRNFFGRWQKEINRFFWSSKRHRITSVQLSKPTKQGGLGLPLFQSYYNASQLRAIYTYLHDHSNNNWTQIEEFGVAPFKLSDILWNLPKERPRLVFHNPFLTLTLQIWDRLCLKLTSPLSPIASFLCQSWFLPARDPTSFPVWRQHNITRFKDIISKRRVVSQQQLEQSNTAHLPWFQYMQVHNMVLKMFGNDVLSCNLTPFEFLLDNKADYMTGLISMIYKMLNFELWETPTSFQNAWERDCGDSSLMDLWPQV